MNLKEIKKKISQSEYDFLRTNPYIKDKILFLTLGGSHAYGTNVSTSDLDVRLVVAEPIESILGISNFEQVLDNATDTVAYGLTKFINLCASANPNIIEMLFTKPEHYLYVSPIGQKLLDNRHLFLSRKLAYTFGGYAEAQLKRLQNAQARDSYPAQEKNEHIAISLNKAIKTLLEQREFDLDSVKATPHDNHIGLSIHLVDVPLNDFKDLYAAITNTTNNYDQLLNRNRKKDDAHLNKHAMHLIRLLLMGIEALETGTLCTYREQDHNLLMSIRNGDYQDKNTGIFKAEFFQMVDDLKNKLNVAKENSVLPAKPKMKEIEKLAIQLKKEIVHNYDSI